MYIWLIFLYGAGFLAFFSWPQKLEEGTLFNLEFNTPQIYGTIIFVLTLILIYKFVDSKYEIKRKGVEN